ncbi:MAG: 1-acyl-sn-glycerol-3-phosphate acyltransferase [Bacteroidota bacterium]
MLDALFRWWFRRKGWNLILPMPDEVYQKAVVIAAPHTTWWDILYTRAAFTMAGIPMRVTIADKYAVWPIKRSLENMGAIWIDRSAPSKQGGRKSYVETMVEIFEQHPKIVTIVTPEGARSLRTKWKTGFYHVAKGAGVPIGLGYLDYAKKEAGIAKVVHTSDDMEADLREIMEFYAPIKAKFPDLFSIDERYAP